jgi:hypothetical protein
LVGSHRVNVCADTSVDAARARAAVGRILENIVSLEIKVLMLTCEFCVVQESKREQVLPGEARHKRNRVIAFLCLWVARGTGKRGKPAVGWACLHGKSRRDGYSDAIYERLGYNQEK